MKNFYVLLSMLVISAMTTAAPVTRIADNNANRPTGTYIYPTLQAAIDAAQPGDVVYIQPSLTSYGNVTIGKNITLMGVGFNNPELGTRTSTVGNISLITSADGANSIAGAHLIGFSFSTISFNTGGVGSFTFDSIIIEKVSGSTINEAAGRAVINDLAVHDCYFNTIGLGANAINNLKIYRNILDQGTQITLANCPNALISNNIFFKSSGGLCNFINITPGSTGVRIEHNIFSGSGYSFANLVDALVVNNIFYGVDPGVCTGGVTFRDNTFSNNLILGTVTLPPTGNAGGVNSGQNNIMGLAPGFTNASVQTSYTPAAAFNYDLVAGSPCINAASTGDNIGPSGGLYPISQNIFFKTSAVPLITLFSNTGVVNQNKPIISNIKARSN